jgi:fumarate hydratase class II
MGPIEVPEDAYYGASTARAVANFPVSNLRMPRRFLAALGTVKAAAAKANRDLHRLDSRIAKAVIQAADEVARGQLDDQFVVDVFQTGSGTSTHMNANEVIANRAAEILGAGRGARDVVHPNDHVNLGQSSNDVIPTALHVAAALALRDDLEPALERLEGRLTALAEATRDEVKIGRTHLQDATPIRFGQVFGGYSGRVSRVRARIARAREDLTEVALGGTAVGTGINTHSEFAARALAHVSRRTGLDFRETDDHVQAQSSIDVALAASACLRSAAVALHGIADDIRHLASGPRCGLGELALPEIQPGSSIMPGKVNPVIAESTVQACARVLGNDQSLVQCALGGQFELNTMLPLASHALLDSIDLLARSADNFGARCLDGLRVTGRGAELVERSLSLATALVPRLGYDRAAAIAKEAAASGRTVREVALAETDLDPGDVDALLDPLHMTRPEG